MKSSGRTPSQPPLLPFTWGLAPDSHMYLPTLSKLLGNIEHHTSTSLTTTIRPIAIIRAAISPEERRQTRTPCA